MRLSSVALRLGVFACAALLCLGAARLIVTAVETRSVVAVQEALLDNDHDWTSVQGDGLQIILEGEAPSEALRFRAMSVAGSVVDSSRVIDNMRVAESQYSLAPDFAIEILRNESGVSLIGLMPASTDRDDVTRRIERAADGAAVADLLDSAAYDAPEGWDDALDFALGALALLPRSKISMSADAVDIRAISASEREQASWTKELQRRAPDGVALTLDITAPRPVITPFTVRFVKDGKGARFDACSADTEEIRHTILNAAKLAGAGSDAECTLGLGVPTKTWGTAISLAIAAVNDLGGGTLTVSDADMRIVALEGTDQSVFDEVIGGLQNDLPEVFSLSSELPLPPDPDAEGPPEFVITRSPEGLAQLRGRVADDLMNMTAENYAQARFGKDSVDMGTRILADNLPQGWAVRVLAGIEAMSHLSSGAVVVRPAEVKVTGKTGSKSAKADISRMLIDKLGREAQFDIEVTYVEALDPIAALPSPEECLAKIVAVSTATKITFEPGSSNIVAGARGAMDDIAEILRKCPELPLRIAGYTDSQGGAEMNKRLSQRRADAVLDGLRVRRVPTSSFAATGYGEDSPIASNDTEAGREANRRIEFTLEPPAVAPVPDAPEAGATADAPETAAPEAAGDPEAAGASESEPSADAAVSPEDASSDAAEAPAETGPTSADALPVRPPTRPQPPAADSEESEADQ